MNAKIAESSAAANAWELASISASVGDDGAFPLPFSASFFFPEQSQSLVQPGRFHEVSAKVVNGFGQIVD